MYTYNAIVERIVDGDTLDLLIDLGFKVLKRRRVRLLGINCPETRTRDLEEKKRGLAAKDFVRIWVKVHPELTVKTHKDKAGKFGRVLAEIFPRGEMEVSLNTELVDNGHAEIYHGGKR